MGGKSDGVAPGAGRKIRGTEGAIVQLAERVAVLARRGYGEGAREALILSLDRFLDKLILSGPSGPNVLPEELQARLCLSLSTLLVGADRELALSALFGLVRLGRFGNMLAARALDQKIVPLEEALPLLAELSPGELLGVVDVLISLGRGPCHDAARTLLPLVAEADLHHARQFLLHCKGRMPGMTQPLAEVLWEGRLGRDIRAADPARDSPDRLRAVAQWLKLLRPADPPGNLARDAALHASKEEAFRLLLAGAAGSVQDKALGRLFSGLLSSAGPGKAWLCLDAARKLVPDKLPQVGAMLYHGKPGMREELAGMLALLGERGFSAFLSYLPAEERSQALRATLTRVASEDPAGLFAAAPEIFPPESAQAGSVGSGADSLEGSPLALSCQPGAAPAPSLPCAVLVPSGVQAAGLHLPPKAPSLPDLAVPQQGQDVLASKGFSLRGLLGMGAQRSKTEIPSEGMWGRLKHQVIEGRAFTGESFLDYWLEDVHFQNCTFVGVTFKAAAFLSTRFTNCRFDGCDFRLARFWDCRFAGCGFIHCGLLGAEISGCALEGTAFNACTLGGARLHGLALQSVRLDGCDLSGLLASQLSMAGVLMRNCLLDGARLWRLSLAGCRLEGVSAKLAEAWDIEGDEPLLRRMAARTLKQALSASVVVVAQGAVAKDVPIAPDLLRGLEEAQAWEALRLWLERQERLAGLRANMTENRRRLDFGLSWLSPAQASFVRLLPFLLHTECFEKAMDLEPVPACRVAAYQPPPGVFALAEEYFPCTGLLEDAPAALTIEAVYTIGSFGTLAQTSGSDLDVWVCFREAPALQAFGDLRAALDAFDAKLSALSAWAGKVFGLETHYYRMDVNSIVANDFGVSHEEGSGSAQAMLLKEEFYRTAVLLAGKAPLWWAVPPGCNKECSLRLSQDFCRQENLLDLGSISAIPRAEFFGAMLWQIFKSIKQPYKSVMKFALLERYLESAGSANAGGTGLLLCEAMKDSLFAGSRELWDLDPYARLFAEVYAHYQRQGRREEAALIRLAFLSKSLLPGKAQDAVQPLTAEQGELRRMYFGKGGNGPNFGGKGAGQIPGWREQGKLGELFSRFILRAYTRLTSHLQDYGNTAITPEDLTRIGRRIMAAFSKRKDKVEIMPFAEGHGQACKVVFFSATRAERNAYRWHIQAGQVKPGDSRLDLVFTRDSADLVAECAWLMANGVFVPGSQVNADYTINPVTAKDLQELLDTLAVFFPHERMFETDTRLALSPEAVAKAFATVNFCLPSETRAVQAMSLIYLTTWGELFVKTLRVKGTPPFDPETLLKHCTGMPCSSGMEFAWLTPARAACPQPFEGERGVEGLEV